jgi:hypothetical protein
VSRALRPVVAGIGGGGGDFREPRAGSARDEELPIWRTAGCARDPVDPGANGSQRAEPSATSTPLTMRSDSKPVATHATVFACLSRFRPGRIATGAPARAQGRISSHDPATTNDSPRAVLRSVALATPHPTARR